MHPSPNKLEMEMQTLVKVMPIPTSQMIKISITSKADPHICAIAFIDALQAESVVNDLKIAIEVVKTS